MKSSSFFCACWAAVCSIGWSLDLTTTLQWPAHHPLYSGTANSNKDKANKTRKTLAIFSCFPFVHELVLLGLILIFLSAIRRTAPSCFFCVPSAIRVEYTYHTVKQILPFLSFFRFRRLPPMGRGPIFLIKPRYSNIVFCKLLPPSLFTLTRKSMRRPCNTPPTESTFAPFLSKLCGII